jgi:LmbE family N-acetylglucosaminyl deacetylase
MPLLSPSGLTSRSRILFFAPHPDDESLAAIVLFSRASRAGAAIRVVYLTDGDNNPWPQRVLEKRWRVRPTDRRRWGKLRRAEAAAALDLLGVDQESIEFLGWPDQMLTRILLSRPAKFISQIAGIIHDWRPTDIIAPDLSDTHPDHSAVAVSVRLAVAQSSRPELVGRHWSYVVHGRAHPTGVHLLQDAEEIACKRRAILCHETQTSLSRRRFLSYADRLERFVRVSAPAFVTGEGPVRRAERRRSTAMLEIRLRLKPRLVRKADQIVILGKNENGEEQSCRILMPIRSGLVPMMTRNGRRLANAQFTVNAFSGVMSVPTSAFAEEASLFIKFQRRSWFFDEAGWIELPATAKPSPETERLAETTELAELAFR